MFFSGWESGDGIGGTEVYIGQVTNNDKCIEKCRKRSKNGKTANGATVDALTEKKCYCEYGQTGRNSNWKWINTFI